MRAVIGVVTVWYAVAILFRVALVVAATRRDHRVRVSDADARAVPDEELPVYTVLVPAYREPEVIGSLLEHLAALEYPTDKLDVKLLLEDDDDETIAAARAALPGRTSSVVIVPAAAPRTKPKALQLRPAAGPRRAGHHLRRRGHPRAAAAAPGGRRAFAGSARRRLPAGRARLLQLRPEPASPAGSPSSTRSGSAVAARAGGAGACRSRSAAPPTTSARDVLREIGAWDPYNVTEDADLGMRLARLRLRRSACSTRSRSRRPTATSSTGSSSASRWYKGYLQTWLVHMRHPLAAARADWAGAGFFCLNVFVGGTPMIALLNPCSGPLTVVWFVARPAVTGDRVRRRRSTTSG